MNNKLAVIDESIDVFRLGEVLVKSGFFTDARDVSQAIVKVLAGRELGIGPIASMRELFIVKGKISMSASLVASRIKGSGRYDYRVRELSPERCVIEFFERGQAVGVSEFSMKDASAAGLTGNDTYKKFGRNMLFSRAMTNGARWYCADVFGGAVYTPEELGVAPSMLDESEIESIPDARPGPAVDIGEPEAQKAAPAAKAPAAIAELKTAPVLTTAGPSSVPSLEEAYAEWQALWAVANKAGIRGSQYFAGPADNISSIIIKANALRQELEARKAKQPVGATGK